MMLSALLAKAGVSPDALAGDAEIASIVSDSRKVTPGALFVCMPSGNSDSHGFIPEALARGAAAFLVHSQMAFDAWSAASTSHPGPPAPATALIAHEGHRFNESLCALCSAFFDYPTRRMKVVGVTGTNGKTTTAWLIRDMLRALGLRAAYLGTLGFHLPDEERELSNTTPFPVEYYTLLAEARDRGVEALAMEVSSHALEERRIEGTEFDVGVFTNLSQDHLDFHGSMEAYEAAKRRLFLSFPRQTSKPFTAAVNMDDSAGASLARDLPASNLVRYRASDCSCDLGIESPCVKVDSIEGVLCAAGERLPVRVSLGGTYNVENLLSAVSGVLALGYPLRDLGPAIAAVRPVPGRFEAVPNSAGIGILVDYAHTPDALEKLLGAVRPLTQGRVITVFGCGGDRDRNKRPKMARAASERSDITVVTSDNPRTEDPQAILDEVLAGIVPGRDCIDIIDRREAIAHAIKIARSGDVVVIAGKGHENYQIIGRTKYPMDDREMAREALGR